MKKVYRCQKTGNPVGTDTYTIGKACQCDTCELAAQVKLLSARIELQSCLSFLEGRQEGAAVSLAIAKDAIKKAMREIALDDSPKVTQ